MKRNEQIDYMLLSTVLFLADRGLSSRAIAEATGLSVAQVFYRTRRFERRLSDYRSGQTEYAKSIIRQSDCAKHNVTATRGQAYRVVGVA